MSAGGDVNEIFCNEGTCGVDVKESTTCSCGIKIKGGNGSCGVVVLNKDWRGSLNAGGCVNDKGLEGNGGIGGRDVNSVTCVSKSGVDVQEVAGG